MRLSRSLFPFVFFASCSRASENEEQCMNALKVGLAALTELKIDQLLDAEVLELYFAKIELLP